MSEIELKEFSVKDNEVSLGGLGMGVQQVGGSGGITQETDPTVPQWAKQPNKPTYTYEEITEKPTLVEKIGSSIEEDTNELTIELKDKDGNVLATSKVKLPSTQIDVDTELSDTSTNPVENQAVTKALGDKLEQEALTNYVKFTDIAGNLKPGLVAGGKNYYGFIVGGDNAIPRTAEWTLEEYKNKLNDYYFIGKGTLENIKNDYVSRAISELGISGGTKWYKHNILVNIQNVTYYNMQIITTSQTAIEYNENGLVIQGTVRGVMYYGAGGSTSNELQYVGILLPFAETYYPTIIDFGYSGLPEVKNFIGGSFFPSDVTEFIDTPTEI